MQEGNSQTDEGRGGRERKEEGRKIVLRIHCGRELRKMEWNTTWRSFEKLESKVREAFEIEEKVKLVFKYSAENNLMVSMSSDEEWTLALEFLEGNLMIIDVERVNDKVRKAYMWTANKGFTMYSSISTHTREISREILLKTRTCLSMYWKPALSVIMILVVLHTSYNVYWQYSHPKEIDILAASFGGVDVTKEVRGYYARTRKISPDYKILGDPAPRRRKYLHVLYQQIPFGNMTLLTMADDESWYFGLDHCTVPMEGFVNGALIQLIGALCGNSQCTCNAANQPWDWVWMDIRHSSVTFFYLKNGELKIASGSPYG